MVKRMHVDFSQDWTLAETIELQGRGLHTGQNARLVLKPAAQAGFWLETEQGLILLDHHRVDRTEWCTEVAGVQTIEHVLAAAYGLGLSALSLRIDGPECPILDGSAKLWAEAMQTAGIVALDTSRRWFEAQAWQADWGPVRIDVSPASELVISYTIDYRHQGRPLYQHLEYRWNPTSFALEIAPARTYTFAADVPKLRAAGLALGGSLANALVLDEQAQVHPDQQLRFENEPVRHKILDLIGDLALCGTHFQGRIAIIGGGHHSHVKMIRRLEQQANL